MPKIERGSTRSHCLENWLWKRLWTFRKAESVLTIPVQVQGDTKKRELLKSSTKIEEIQEKKIIDRN